MWWCCGKTKKNAPGCKYAKHIYKKDDDDDDEIEENGQQKRLKCYICKEKGHKAEDCERDPNFRTNKDIDQEVERLENCKVKKLLNSDAMQVTFKMLERFALVSSERLIK